MANNRNRKNPFEKETEYLPNEDELVEGMKQALLSNPELMSLFREKLLEEESNRLRESLDSITAADWKDTHPVGISCASDSYYAKLADRIQREFAEMKFPPNLPYNLLRECALSVVAYLEDVKSDIGIWHVIRKMYKDKYTDTLPFYDCHHDSYFYDDLNIEDVRLLIWQAWNRCGQTEGRIFSPYSPAVYKMSEIVYDIFVDEFDEAPESARVKNEITKIFKKSDFYDLRQLGLWIVADNKITATPFTREHIMEEAVSYVGNSKGKMDIEMACYLNETEEAMSPHVSMLGCLTLKIVAELARYHGFDDTASKIDNMDVRLFGEYEIISTDRKFVYVKNALGETFNVIKSSIGKVPDFEDFKGMNATIAKFGDEWMVTGVAGYVDKAPVFSDGYMAGMKITAEIQEHCRDIIRSNRGRKVFYCKDLDEVRSIVKLINPIPVGEDENFAPRNFLLMISENVIPVLVPDACEFFSDRANPFYDSKADRKIIGKKELDFISQGLMPDDVAEYVQNKRLLPHANIFASQGAKVGKNIVQDNLRFLNNFYTVKVPAPDLDDEDDDYDYDYDD